MNRLIKSIQLWAKEKGLLDADPKAQYKYVEGFPRHVISKCGNVVRLGYVDARGYNRKPIVISQHLDADGYLKLRLQHEGKERFVSIHRLLAEHFIPNPDKKETVNHIDGNKTNNDLGNLEWATMSEQMMHAYGMGLKESTHKQRQRTSHANSKPVKCINKQLNKTTYYLSAKDCSLDNGYSSGWCDKTISSASGETMKFSLTYVPIEELKDNLEKTTFDTKITLVQRWAMKKGLLKSDPKAQLLKTFEEVSEATQAYMRGQRENLLEEIGDIFVTVIIFAEQVGINPEEALKVAYDKIKDRQGRMVDGSWIKIEDLEEME